LDKHSHDTKQQFALTARNSNSSAQTNAYQPDGFIFGAGVFGLFLLFYPALLFGRGFAGWALMPFICISIAV
jgi:hypothetical protein